MDGNENVHCPHAGWTGAGVCGSLCDNYCYQQNTTCALDTPDRIPDPACQDLCSYFPAGTPGDVQGNSIDCRMYHMSVAAGTSTTTHCPHVGYTGGNVCGTWCDNYCSWTGSLCDLNYKDYPTCMVACAAMNVGAQGDQSGPSATCRTYHTVASVIFNNDVHCTHAAQISLSGVCGTNIQNTCQFSTNACLGPLATYATEPNCEAILAPFPAGTPAGTDTSGNSVSCRLYHVTTGINLNQTNIHCPHAGPDGGNGVCGTICDAYCTLSNVTCPQNFGSNDACYTACAKFNATGVPGATGGDTIQCRLYHVGVATISSGTDRTTHCTHASVGGAGVCGGSTATTGTGTATGTSTGTGTSETTSSAAVVVASLSLLALFI